MLRNEINWMIEREGGACEAKQLLVIWLRRNLPDEDILGIVKLTFFCLGIQLRFN